MKKRSPWAFGLRGAAILSVVAVINLAIVNIKYIWSTVPVADENPTHVPPRFPNVDRNFASDPTVAVKKASVERSPSSGPYTPASVEKHIMDNLKNWGWNSERNPLGCTMWKDPSHALYKDLHSFLPELEKYQEMVRDFPGIDADLRELKRSMSQSTSYSTVCEKVKLGGPGGLNGIFPSGQLSWSTSSGYMEPLTTPMRHPRFCDDQTFLMSMDYMVHDFEAICQKIHPDSKTVLLDIGSSLSHHRIPSRANSDVPVEANNPAVGLLDLYQKFGIRFDHIYAVETESSAANGGGGENSPLPEGYPGSYHKLSTPILFGAKNDQNPLNSILQKYKTDDFVVIILDMGEKIGADAAKLAQQLRQESLSKLVDQLYFEQPVYMKEMARIWGWSMARSLKDSFELFHGLRQHGVSAHFWV